jgi:hypothetical protein
MQIFSFLWPDPAVLQQLRAICVAVKKMPFPEACDAVSRALACWSEVLDKGLTGEAALDFTANQVGAVADELLSLDLRWCTPSQTREDLPLLLRVPIIPCLQGNVPVFVPCTQLLFLADDAEAVYWGKLFPEAFIVSLTPQAVHSSFFQWATKPRFVDQFLVEPWCPVIRPLSSAVRRTVETGPDVRSQGILCSALKGCLQWAQRWLITKDPNRYFILAAEGLILQRLQGV